MGESTHQPEYDCPLSTASVILVMPPRWGALTDPRQLVLDGGRSRFRPDRSASIQTRRKRPRPAVRPDEGADIMSGGVPPVARGRSGSVLVMGRRGAVHRPYGIRVRRDHPAAVAGCTRRGMSARRVRRFRPCRRPHRVRPYRARLRGRPAPGTGHRGARLALRAARPGDRRRGRPGPAGLALVALRAPGAARSGRPGNRNRDLRAVRQIVDRGRGVRRGRCAALRLDLCSQHTDVASEGRHRVAAAVRLARELLGATVGVVYP